MNKFLAPLWRLVKKTMNTKKVSKLELVICVGAYNLRTTCKGCNICSIRKYRGLFIKEYESKCMCN